MGDNSQEVAKTSGNQSKARMSVLADGTSVDQDYFQSKAYILDQLEAKRAQNIEVDGSKSLQEKASKSQEKGEGVDKATNAMLKSGAISEDDGWLLASMELPIRNPFCIANHPAKDQVRVYQKVFLMSSIFMFMVALATVMWTWWWGILIQQGMKPIMPCMGRNDVTFGKVRFCNDTSDKWNTELTDDGCNEDAPLSVCVEDTCINDPDVELRSCWYVAAFVMVVFAAYMLLLFRRDQAGKGLLSCACFIEGILGGAGTLHYDSSVFLEFFTYLTSASLLGLMIFTYFSRKNMEMWEKLPTQVGSTSMKVPAIEHAIHGAVKKAYVIGGCITTFLALVWHFGTPVRLTGGSTLAFFLALFTLAISIGWILREISWTQHKYDADQFVNMCISFHVDLYCICILFMTFTFFILNDSCHAGPIQCCPKFINACQIMGSRCTIFICGCSKKKEEDQSDDLSVTGSQSIQKRNSMSVQVDKEVETTEAWRRRKMVNAGCAFGILALTGLSFFRPELSFAAALFICVFLPFFRAATNKEDVSETQDQANV
jgi:ABC-type multidrug transport system fused ATPase/permease subunit